MDAIRAKKDVDQLQTILNNIPANATGHEDLNADGMGDSFCSLHLPIAGVWQRGLRTFARKFSNIDFFFWGFLPL